jgi:hypothetical protein
MTLAFQSLLMTVLLVCGAVAFLPALLSQSTPQLSPSLRAGLQGPGLWVVESPKGQWFANGALLSRGDLAKLIEGKGKQQLIHYLPSDALQLEKVSLSLGWLRSLAPGAVVLELPPRTLLSR